MRLLVYTGVFSASLSHRRSAATSHLVEILSANQIFLAAVTVAELRFGALVAGLGMLADNDSRKASGRPRWFPSRTFF